MPSLSAAPEKVATLPDCAVLPLSAEALVFSETDADGAALTVSVMAALDVLLLPVKKDGSVMPMVTRCITRQKSRETVRPRWARIQFFLSFLRKT